MNNLTDAQATDLARYFFSDYGCEYICAGSRKAGGYWLTLGFITSYADSWRELFRKNGVSLPVRPRFTARKAIVLNGSQEIARCVSNTMALRVANALNCYNPGLRGT